MSTRLTPETYQQGLRILAGRESHFAAILQKYGSPPLWDREPGFPTLLKIILEQQVSLASAAAAFRKLQEIVDPLTPHRFLELDDAQLKNAGFSRQKTAYGRNLAQAILDCSIDLDALVQLPPEAVRAALVKIKGIGCWTADIYLLMALLHADIWPRGDLALAKAVQQRLGLPQVPDDDQLDEMSQGWSPWRAVAARLFWYDYLDGKD
jgi:DNA-3-methyladenine glycosylase II